MIQFLDALAFFFLITMGIIGFRRGLIEELGRFLGILLAAIFSLKFYTILGTTFINLIFIDIWVSFVLSFILISVFLLV